MDHRSADTHGRWQPRAEWWRIGAASAYGRPTMSPEIRHLYRTMQLIRNAEEQLARCHARGLIHGACHTYVGEEAVAAGVCSQLRSDDVVFSTHRGHGHALAKGLALAEL